MVTKDELHVATEAALADAEAVPILRRAHCPAETILRHETAIA